MVFRSRDWTSPRACLPAAYQDREDNHDRVFYDRDLFLAIMLAVYRGAVAFAGPCLVLFLTHRVKVAFEAFLAYFAEHLWPSQGSYHGRLVERHVDYFTDRRNEQNSRGYWPTAVLDLNDDEGMSLGIPGRVGQPTMAYLRAVVDGMSWVAASRQTRPVVRNSLADLFNTKEAFCKAFEGIPSSFETMAGRARREFGDYAQWTDGPDLPSQIDSHMEPLANIAVPNIFVHLLGKETTFCSLPFLSGWLWERGGWNEGRPKDVPDDGRELWLEWSPYRLVQEVDGDVVGLRVGRHKLKDETIEGYYWLYKVCDSGRFSMQLEWSQEAHQPALYAYWGMGVELQHNHISGVVVRSKKFAALAALLKAIQTSGGVQLRYLFDEEHVLNQAEKDVAQAFRQTMARYGINVSAAAGLNLTQTQPADGDD